MGSLTDAAPAAHDAHEAHEARVASRRSARRSPITRDGLSTLVFLLPFLIVFGVFAWYPIVRALVMGFQETNLVSEPGLGRPPELPARARGPAVRHRRQEHPVLHAAGAGVRLPDPDRPRRPDERGPPRSRPVQRAGLPAGGRPAGRRGPAVALLLRRLARPACSTRSSAGSGSARCHGSRTPGMAMPSIVIEATWAAAGATVIIYLAALLGVPPELYDAAEVDGALAVAEDPPRDAAPAAERHLRHADPAADRHGAALHRAAAVHGRRAGQLDDDGAAADLQVRLPEQPGRRLRHGRGAERDAGGVPRRVHGRLLLG